MTDLTYLKAALLGIVQGLTEFLPVSSSGHLVLVQECMTLDQDSPTMLAFTVISHLGTLLAIAVVFHKSFLRLLKPSPVNRRIGAQALVACTLTAAIGLPLESWIESLFASPALVALAMAVTGVLLFIVDRLPKPRRDWRQFGWLAAATVGVSQAVALVPGISRSGATICCALLWGLKRRHAAEFSFLIAAPAILGATAIQVYKLTQGGIETAPGSITGPMVLGGAVAAVVGYFALIWLLSLLRRARLHLFSYYLWTLSFITLLLCALGVM